jgi:hypothetical protein
LIAEDFITRWQGVTASELATAQSFVIDLCALLEVDKPHPTPEQIKDLANLFGTATQNPNTIAALFKDKGRWRMHLAMILDNLVAIGRTKTTANNKRSGRA